MQIRERENALCAAKARILVIESYGNLRELYRELLEQEGYSVWTASGRIETDEAMDLLRPDVVVIDPDECIDMQGVMQKTRSDSEGCPLVVFNCGTMPGGDSEEMYSIHACVLKSSDVGSLIDVVESALRSRSAGSRMS